MYLTTSYTGLTFIENLTFEHKFQNHSFDRYGGFNEGDTYRIYKLLGLDTNTSKFSIEMSLKHFNMLHQIENIRLCEGFVSNKNIEHLIDLSFLNKLGVESTYSKKINKINEVIRASNTLFNMAQLKMSLSFNELLEQWGEKINPENVQAFTSLQKAYAIANKYFTKKDYEEKKLNIKNYEKYIKDELSIPFNKKNIDKKFNDFKVIIKNLIAIVNTELFENLDQFEKDKILIQDILISLVTTNKELINLDNYPESEAVKFLKNPFKLAGEIESRECLAHYYPKSNQYYSIILFDDGSMLAQHSKESDFEMFYNFRSLPQIAFELLEENLKHKTKKNPVISKAFLSKFKELNLIKEQNCDFSEHSASQYGYGYAPLYRVLVYYFENENALKSNKFNIIEALQKNINLEYTEDEMNKIMKFHEVKKYKKALLSKKYDHLYSEEIFSVLTEFYNLSVSIETLKSYVGKKIAAFNTSEELFDALENTLSLVTNFNAEWVRETAQRVNAKIISEKDNKIIVQLEKFEQSKILGTSSWCISRTEDYFEGYISNNCKQYVVYDFTKKSTDHMSMLGCTLSADFKFKVAHWKNDQKIDELNKSDDHVAINYIINEVKEERDTFFKKLMRSTSFYFDYYFRTEKTR